MPGLLLTTLFAAISWQDEVEDRAFRDRTTVATATIEADWDGERMVPVTYRDPADGTMRRTVVPWGAYPPDRSTRTVEIRVGAGPDPEVGPQPYGDPGRWPTLLQFAVPAVGGAGVWFAVRRHRLQRSRRLIASPEPTYRMLAVPRAGRLFGRRWRLALHEVDARPGDRAVCVVPVVGQPLREGVRPVEVKGRPRPGGEVVVREEGGRLWWPAGRAMVGARSRLPSRSDRLGPLAVDRGRVPGVTWVLLGTTGLCVVAWTASVDGPVAAADRSVPSNATVVVGRSSPGPVTVDLEWKGEPRTAQVEVAGPVEAGETVAVRVDPERPSRVWADGQEVPVLDDPGWVVLLATVAVPVFIVALAGVRRPRDPFRDRLDDPVPDGGREHGFDLLDGTLWYRGEGRRPSAVRRLWPWRRPALPPVLGFEPAGLLVCTEHLVDVWPWDRHVGRDATSLRWYAASDGTRLTLVAPGTVVEVSGPDGASVVELVEAVSRTSGIQERLADREWLEGVMAALAIEGPRRGPAGPRILGDG